MAEKVQVNADKLKVLNAVMEKIEKDFGKGSIMRMNSQEVSDVPVIPTGSITLDIALGVGGYPKGRVVEIYGPESSGKTTLAIHAIAEAQKAGGIAAFIDAEHAFDSFYAQKLGVDVDNLLISQPDNGEQALEIADSLIRSSAIDIIVIDSVAALNSPTENAVDFLDNFKLSLYTSEIVVFTPKGEARKMPFGATALDFAYDIHSKIGNSAISAKINHKLEPITTQINSGDQIEIITADNARPKPEWLEIATTAKAKQSIKSFLKRERQNNIERGMQMLDEKMKSLNIKLSGRVLRKIVPIYESNNKEELYSKIGAGIIDLKDLDKVLKVNSKSKILKFWTLFINKKEDEEGDDPAAINDAGETAPNAAHPAKEQPETPQFEIAECCKPIPGDKVVGYRDPKTGNIIVHKATCDELNRLATQFGRNIVKEEIKWSQHKAMSYLVTIELRGIDRMGILLDLAKVVSADFSINIREVGIHSHDGIFEGSISLYVKDAEGLQDVMTKLRKIKGIESVKRTLS